VRKWLIFAAVLGCGSVLLGFVAGNIFPEQTWIVLTSVEERYGSIVSLMTPIPTGSDRKLQEAAIHDAVFQDWIESHKVKCPVFLRVDGKDPNDDFMARFANSERAVNKASEAYFDHSTLRGPLDRSTGRRGILLSASSIKWLFGDRIEVNFSENCGLLCGRGDVYQLVKQHGRWTVEGSKLRFFN
jgi:hypothetical protein